jgi:hypothetical protein
MLCARQSSAELAAQMALGSAHAHSWRRADGRCGSRSWFRHEGEVKLYQSTSDADDGTVTYDMRTGFLPCAGYGRSIEGYSDFDLYGYNGATCEDIKGVCGDADPACGAGGATNADTGCSVVEVECCCPCENWYDWFFSSAFLFVLCCCLGGGFAVKKATKKKEKGGDEEQGDDDTSSG